MKKKLSFLERAAAVPHMATQTLADFGFSVTSEEVEAEYKAQRAEGDLFTFRSEYLSGKSEPTLKVAKEISRQLNIDANIVLGV